MIILDANSDRNWDKILIETKYWVVSVGTFHPDHCDPIDVSDEDVALLLQKAVMIISDREKFRDLAHSCEIPFVHVDQEDVLERVRNGR